METCIVVLLFFNSSWRARRKQNRGNFKFCHVHRGGIMSVMHRHGCMWSWVPRRIKSSAHRKTSKLHKTEMSAATTWEPWFRDWEQCSSFFKVRFIAADLATRPWKLETEKEHNHNSSSGQNRSIITVTRTLRNHPWASLPWEPGNRQSRRLSDLNRIHAVNTEVKPSPSPVTSNDCSSQNVDAEGVLQI